MPIARLPTIAALAAVCLVAVPARAQTIRGQLVDADRGFPLPSGVLTLLVQDTVEAAVVQADSAGRFVLEAPGPGLVRLSALRTGYQTTISSALHVAATDTLDVEFRLSANVTVLEPLVVVGRSRRLRGPIAGFYERARRQGFGSFFTRDEIERFRVVRTTEVLRRLPGVRLSPVGIGTGSQITTRGNCVPTIYIDGTRVRAGATVVDDLVNPRDLEGVEVYRTASDAPPQYVGTCSVILIWTRRAP